MTTASSEHRPSFAGSLLALARMQVQYFRPVPLEGFSLLSLAPDSTHKYGPGGKGGHFEIQPGFVYSKGGIVFRNPEGDYYGLFVNEEVTTLAIERLYPHSRKSEDLVLKNRPDKSPMTVTLSKTDVKRYPVGKELRIVVVVKDAKPAIHFYNKSQLPMDVPLFRAHEDSSLQSEDSPEARATSDDTVPAGSGSGAAWNLVRLVASHFNSTIIFFGLAAGMILTSLVVRHYYVREFVRQTRGEPYAVNLAKQHLNVRFNDSSATHALATKELSYPIFQALTFLGRGHLNRVESITVADTQPPEADKFDVRVSLGGSDARTFPVSLKDPAGGGMRDLQNFIFDGDLERAQMEAVAIPDILTTFFLLMFLAAGFFILWGAWQLWHKYQEITAGMRVHEFASPHKIIGALDANAQRNIGEKLGPDRDEQQILGEVDTHQTKKKSLEEEQKNRRQAQQDQLARREGKGE